MLGVKSARQSGRSSDGMTDSLTRVLRWHYGDYASMFCKQLELLRTDGLSADLDSSERQPTGARRRPER